MSLLRPLYQNNYLPSSPHIHLQRYQENYCTKQDKEVFQGHFFSLSGVSSICRQIKPQAGPLASCCRRRRRFFVLFVCLFFPSSFNFTRSGTQTNKQTLLKKREKKKANLQKSNLFLHAPRLSCLTRNVVSGQELLCLLRPMSQ